MSGKFQSMASLIGTALWFAGLTFAIASTELSSRYSVENFSKDATILQRACNALSTYFLIALVWTLATCLVLYGQYGMSGVFWGIITNALFIAWIMGSYWMTFRKVSKAKGLPMPKLFDLSYDPEHVIRNGS